MNRDPLCARCQLGTDGCEHRCVWGQGPVPCPIMLVGEAPGFNEDKRGEPFVGRAGDLLDHIFGKLGVSRDDVYITNVFKCRPPLNKLPAAGMLDKCWGACQRYLAEEYLEVAPQVTVLLGNTALKYIGGKNFISRWQGLKFDAPIWGDSPRPVIAAYHPAAVLRNPSMEAPLATAIAQAFVMAGIERKERNHDFSLFQYE